MKLDSNALKTVSSQDRQFASNLRLDLFVFRCLRGKLPNLPQESKLAQICVKRPDRSCGINNDPREWVGGRNTCYEDNKAHQNESITPSSFHTHVGRLDEEIAEVCSVEIQCKYCYGILRGSSGIFRTQHEPNSLFVRTKDDVSEDWNVAHRCAPQDRQKKKLEKVVVQTRVFTNSTGPAEKRWQRIDKHSS